MSAPRARSTYGEGDVDQLLSEILGKVGPDRNDDLIRRLLVTALDMDAGDVARLDLKIASQTLAEMLNGYQVFAQDPDCAKVTIFGSARTKPDDANYQLASAFAAAVAEREWMVISGAGPGIMQAAIEGAGVENSYGVSIVLPFEAKAVDIIDGDPKLAGFKYFFTRKLFFVKEADAFAMFPGGFGTLDEAFELLTLIQTGKTYPAPVVLLDAPDSTYWSGWETFVQNELAEGGMVSAADSALYLHTHDPEEAADYICHFYSTYHSLRYVGKRLILRLNQPLDASDVAALNDEFGDLCADGTIESAGATDSEQREDDELTLFRLSLQFDNRSFARLTEMIHRINDLGGRDEAVLRGMVHDIDTGPEVD